MRLSYYLRKAKDVSVLDYFSVFPMFAGFVLSYFCKEKYRSSWAICERENEARDNGYHFFKYMKTEHPEQTCYYAIKKDCSDFKKIATFDNIVNFGSIKHWILYFNCRYLISSQSFKPNNYLCTFLERSKLFQPHHVFLQHGITINKPEYLEANRRKVDFFMTVTPQETQFVKDELGYSDEQVQMLGFPRFDALHSFKTEKNTILIMPTWRKWLRLKSEQIEDQTLDQNMDEFINAWRSLLSHPEFLSFVEDKDFRVIFLMHSNMKDVIPTSIFASKNIEVFDLGNCDLQGLMKIASLMITDYSSVFFDMVYMKKPVIFYQFDEQKFREFHYKQGWFDYKKTSFAQWCSNADEVVNALKVDYSFDYAPSPEYLNEHKKDFPLYDEHNSARIYDFLSKN